jgi:hypothetical protein
MGSSDIFSPRRCRTPDTANLRQRLTASLTQQALANNPNRSICALGLASGFACDRLTPIVCN